MTTPARTEPAETTDLRGGRQTWPLLTAAVLGVALLASVIGGALSGASVPLQLGDPGPLVRWLLPPAGTVANLAAAATVGGLLLQAAALSPGTAAWQRAQRITLPAAMVWATATALVLVLSAASTAGLPLNHPAFSDALSQYVSIVEVGRLQLWALGLAALTAVVVAAVQGLTGVGWATAVGIVALVPLGLSGHAAGPGHEVVASAWFLHVVAAAAWFGGLFTLALIARRCAADGTLAVITRRYSTIALWAYVVLLFGGVAGAIPRLDGPAGLASGYGLLLIAKTVLLVLLGVAGWLQRQRVIPRLDSEPGAFRRLAAGELLVMGAAFGLAAALARTRPPNVGELPRDPSPAEVVTGLPLPPPLTTARLFTEITPDVLWIAISVSMAVAYLTLVLRLHRRGDKWPLWRTISWLIGCLLLLYVTCGGIAVYGRVLFSAHMIGHMALSMVVPPFLVFAAPITLILRGSPARKDGSRGPREWLLAVMESRYLKVVAHPVAAALIFTGSLVGFYYSDLFGLALRTHLGHELMMVHFLLSGYLFVFALVGVDPAPVRVAYPLRLLLLFVTMAFHAFFAVSLMSQETLLQATYFSSLGWGIDALADQREGGAITWGIGEVPTLLIALIVAVQWARSDDRAARQHDRAADRNHDADLTAYNEMLAQLRARDRARSTGTDR